MKRYVAAIVVAASALTLVACGNAEKEKAMQEQIDTCTKDKATSDAKVTELQAKVDDLTKQLDAAKATPTPAPEPEKGKTKGKATAKATPKPATPAATPKPTGPKPAPSKVLKGLKGGKIH